MIVEALVTLRGGRSVLLYLDGGSVVGIGLSALFALGMIEAPSEHQCDQAQLEILKVSDIVDSLVSVSGSNNLESLARPPSCLRLYASRRPPAARQGKAGQRHR